MESITLLIVQGSISGTLSNAALHSEPLGKFIVFILIIFSILSWAVVGRKVFLFWRVDAENHDFLDTFESINNDFHLAFEHAQDLGSAPLANIFSEVYKELRMLARKETGKVVITPEGIDLVQKAADRQIALEISKQERFLSVIGTTAHVSPLLGLFGPLSFFKKLS